MKKDMRLITQVSRDQCVTYITWTRFFKETMLN